MVRDAKHGKEVTRRPAGGPVINEERAQQRSGMRTRAQPQHQSTQTGRKGKGKAQRQQPSSSEDESDEEVGEERLPQQSNQYIQYFMDRESQEWYHNNITTRIVVELPISDEVENSLHIANAFEQIGWEDIASIRGQYDTEIIMEFYANLKRTFDSKSTNPILESYLRGRKVTISPEDIEQAMGVPSQGFPVVVTKQPKMVHDKKFNFDITKTAIDIDMELYGESGKMTVNRLDVLARVCAHLFNFNMLPRASCYNELRNGDLYLLSRLVGVAQEDYVEVPLSWPKTVCQQVLEARFHKKRAMVFPITLYTTLKRKYGKAILANKEEELSNQVDVFNAKKMELLGFQLLEGQWQRRVGGDQVRRNVRRRVDEQGEDDQEEAQDYSNRALMQQLMQNNLLMESMSQQIKSLSMGSDRNEERLRQVVARHEELDSRTLQILEHQRRMAEEQSHMRDYLMQYGYRPYDGAGPSNPNP